MRALYVEVSNLTLKPLSDLYDGPKPYSIYEGPLSKLYNHPERATPIDTCKEALGVLMKALVYWLRV